MRQDKFLKLFPNQPKYRWSQIQQSFFNPQIKDWRDITTLSQEMREILSTNLDWLSVKEDRLLTSAKNDTFKAVLRLDDNQKIETVLMENSKQEYTLCLSSQVGCAMGCLFCATAKMGFKRNLTEDEIIDQFRFWNDFLNQNHPTKRISNLVFMGMGEPVNNYENVIAAIGTILKYTNIGPTKITLSTVGIFPKMNIILDDPYWPNVKVAISLHSPNLVSRKTIVPSTTTSFFKDLLSWSKKYVAKYDNRHHHLSFEYALIKNLNDSPDDAKKLIELIRKIGQVKVNLITLNSIKNSPFEKSPADNLERFISILRKANINVTRRKTRGDDILAACGQLIAQAKL